MPYSVYVPDFFKSILKQIRKRYPHAGDDLKNGLSLLVTQPSLGRAIEGFGNVRKIRLRNSDVQKGKRGGYRLIYLEDCKDEFIIPLIMYSKSQKNDVTVNELRNLLTKIRQELSTFS